MTGEVCVHATLVLDTYAVVDGRLRDLAWRLYNAAFEELRTAAAQRHLMTAEEFDAVMVEPAVAKYVARSDDGAVRALATLTRNLSTMPLVSPDFFAARWPEHYASGRCWYIGFVAVDPDYHGTGVFADIVGDMTRTVGECGGVAVLDVCTRNSEVYRLPQAILRIAQSQIADVVGTPVDTQTYWSFEAPVPAAATPDTGAEPRGRVAAGLRALLPR